jgi:hypothetical protein
MSYLKEFNKCDLEPNLLCDTDHNCLECIKQENLWAENWINGRKTETETEAKPIKFRPKAIRN